MMTQLRSIQNELLEFISQHADAEEPVDAETDLLEASILDSLLVMDIVAHVEETYSIALDAGELGAHNFRTVDRLANLVASKMPRRDAA